MKYLMYIHIIILTMLLNGTVASAGKPEYRGLWVDAWGPGFNTESEVIDLVAKARAGNFNLILPNMRRRGEVFYNSEIEPKAANIANDFDPLEALIRHAHNGEPKIEIHPYITMMPVWNHENRRPSQPNHPYNIRTDWFMLDSQGRDWDRNYSLDPGHPAVRDHLHSLIMEIVTNYPVDGIHLDHLRYPGVTWGYNSVSLKRFQNLTQDHRHPDPTDHRWQEFRREQISSLVRRLYLSTKTARTDITFSVAAITWAPGPMHQDDWKSTAAYSRLFQDWHCWMQEGAVDVIMPMVYLDLRNNSEDWHRWIRFIKDNRRDRHAAIGIGLFKNTLPETIQQINDARRSSSHGGTSQGVIGFSYRVPDVDRGPFDNLVKALTCNDDGRSQAVFAEPVSTPALPSLARRSCGHLLAKLVDGEAMPLNDTQVQISGPRSFRTTTDASGIIAALNLPQGNYSVKLVDSRNPSALEAESQSFRIEEGRISKVQWTLTGH